MNFIADREKMHQKMRYFEKKYKSAIRKLPQDFFPRAMAEYIIGKTLCADGLIHKYINSSTISGLDKEKRDFIMYQANNPWRYAFARIIDHPEKDFFMMYDEFLRDELLMYSPGIESYFNEGYQNALYFILTGYNGKCWQTYGLMIPMKSFSADDIYFYGTELSAKVDSDETLMESVYSDPMPYMMLAVGMEHPVVVNKNDEIRVYVAEDDIRNIDTQSIKKHFTTEWNKQVYRFKNAKWSEPPHFAIAYYNEQTGGLYRHAMTAEGFNQLSNMLVDLGIDIDPFEDYNVNPGMLITIDHITGKKPVTDPYEKLFIKLVDKDSSEELNKLNFFMNLLLPYINSGTKPDIRQLANDSDVDIDTAQRLYDKLKDRTGR